MKKLNVSKVNALVNFFAETNAFSATKKEMLNLLGPDPRNCILYHLSHVQQLKTKEHKDGCPYPAEKFRVVYRFIDGKVFLKNEDKQPDVYAWKHEKLENLYKKTPEAIQVLGYMSEEAAKNSETFLSSLATDEDRAMVENYLRYINDDYLLVTTPEEDRIVMEVSQEMAAAGLTAIVPDYVDPDENGEAEGIPVAIGDFLVLTNNGCYMIGRDEFLATHKL